MKRTPNSIPSIASFSKHPNVLQLGKGAWAEVYAKKRGRIAYKYGNIEPLECEIQQLAADLGIAPEVYECEERAIAMQNLRGYLRLIDVAGDLTDPKLVFVWLAILDVMQEMHLAGLAHRDLHAKNILLHPKGRIMLIDWGNARIGQPTEIQNELLQYFTNPLDRRTEDWWYWGEGMRLWMVKRGYEAEQQQMVQIAWALPKKRELEGQRSFDAAILNAFYQAERDILLSLPEALPEAQKRPKKRGQR